jgi:hypothetical protein
MNIWSYVKEVYMVNLEIKSCSINFHCLRKSYYPKMKEEFMDT